MFNKISKTIKKTGKLIEKEIQKDRQKTLNIPDALKKVLRTKSEEQMEDVLSKYKNGDELIEFYKPIVRYPFQEALEAYEALGLNITQIKDHYIISGDISEEDYGDIIEMLEQEDTNNKAVIDDDIKRIIKSDLTDEEIITLVNTKLEDK